MINPKQRMRLLDEKISKVENSLKEDLFKNKKLEKEKLIFKALKNLAEGQEEVKDYDDDSEDINQKIMKIVADLDLKQALDYIFESKSLIIFSMDECINQLKNNKKICYEEITKILNEVLKIKSKNEACGDVK